ncbi:DUF1993 family protein [Sphingopyxis sp. EG6]|uniref:DUF1993 family protein n=1 Tax=Sphingopyxis sp. EG6 TaxID=1874061 RepID=UPI000DC627B2|nr:DUF1993 family protein [Sphingopyxis sp. EG6]BBB10179.1 hypothetical protein SPYCW_3195 [Sphingopyxis sp. EG6]
MAYARSALTIFHDMLGTLDRLLRKAEEADMADNVLAAKLTDDMFPLELQIRVAINQVLLALNQVGGLAVSLEEATYHSLAQARERVAVVRALVERANGDDWAAADSTVDLTLPNGVRFLMSSEEDIRDWIMPNFYFHITMVYALLRNAGLAIGKMDFIPHMDRYKVPVAE